MFLVGQLRTLGLVGGAEYAFRVYQMGQFARYERFFLLTQCRGCGNIEARFHFCFHLVDVLPTLAAGAGSAEYKFGFEQISVHGG